MYAKPIAIFILFAISAGGIYAFTSKSHEERIQEAIIAQNEAIEETNKAKIGSYIAIKSKCEATASGSSEEILAKLSECSAMEKPNLQKKVGDNRNIKGVSKNNETVVSATGSVSPVASGSKISIENHYQKEPTVETCSDFPMKKVQGVVIHYTGADEKSAEQVEKNHTNRWNLTTYTSAYHYLIEKDGKIVRPRSETCGSLALGDTATMDNQETINVTYLGSGKPTAKQLESLIILVRDIQNRYGLPRDYVTAHADVQSKNHKESMEGMFGSKAEFVKKMRLLDKVTIYGKESPELTYMWQAWGDEDFIGTIFAESRFNNSSIGDGGQSIGYCQLHKGFQPGWHAEYSKLTTMEQRLNYCHEKYIYASNLIGGVGSRFHGYNFREKHIKNMDRQIALP